MAVSGKRLVVFESLYYVNGFDSHLITEHNDIDDDDQSVDIISITTLATNKETGEKTLPVDTEAEIKDVVSYCLRPGVQYTVKGILMSSATGNGVLYNSELVENEVTFTPEEACGSFDTFYKVNTKDLGGVKLIVFESLYDADGELILEHKDFNNENEMVFVDLPVPETPETGFVTGLGAGAKPVIMSVLGIAAVTFVVVWSKRSHKSSRKITFDKK